MKLRFGPLVLVLLLMLVGCGGGVRDENTKPVKGAKKSSRINVELGVLYMRQGNYKNAMLRLKKAVNHDPDNAFAYASLALLYSRLKQNDLAEENFARAIELSPKDAGIHNNYGAFLCRQKKYVEAQRQFKIALGIPLYNTPEFVYLNAGICAQDTATAEKNLRAALRIKPKFPAALLQMSKLSLKLKRYLSARAYLQRFHAEVKPTPASLWISIQVESVLGDRGTMESHALLLKGKYPDSEETRLYLLWKNK